MNAVYEPGALLWTTHFLTQSLLENPLNVILVIICIVVTSILLLSRKRNTTIMDHLKKFLNESRPVLRNEPKDKIGRFFNDERIAHMNSSIHEFLTTKKPFLQQKYSLSELASDVDIPLHYLSAFINRYHKMSFTHFINRYRVAEVNESLRVANGNTGRWKRLHPKQALITGTHSQQRLKRKSVSHHLSICSPSKS